MNPGYRGGRPSLRLGRATCYRDFMGHNRLGVPDSPARTSCIGMLVHDYGERGRRAVSDRHVLIGVYTTLLRCLDNTSLIKPCSISSERSAGFFFSLPLGDVD
jgi:hypothetical protein